jgi:hypothetical protein
MKRLLPLLFLLCSSCLSFGQIFVPPLPTSSLWISNTSPDSIAVGCGTPHLAEFSCDGGVTWLDSTGSIMVSISFGDGQDTTVVSNLVIDTISADSFSASVFHTYQTPGTYTVELRAWWPLHPNYNDFWNANIRTIQYIVADTCGNVEGSIYMDENFNCIKDSGEAAIPNAYVRITSNGQFYGADFADANGMYHFNMPAGQAYEVELNTGGFTDVCPSNVLQIPAEWLWIPTRYGRVFKPTGLEQLMHAAIRNH